VQYTRFGYLGANSANERPKTNVCININYLKTITCLVEIGKYPIKAKRADIPLFLTSLLRPG
jgi:hypothetical protein